MARRVARFADEGEVKTVVEEFFASKAAGWYPAGINELLDRYGQVSSEIW